MTIVPYTHEMHFDLVSKWWNRNGYAPLNQEYISPTSFMVFHHDTPMAFVCIVTTNITGYCVLEYLVADPELPPGIRREAIHFLSMFLDDYCASLGFKTILGYVKHEKLAERYQGYGYRVNCKGVTVVSKEMAWEA